MSLPNRLPACYDIFMGTKIYNIIDHPTNNDDKIFLKVPFAGSSQVKALGAKFGNGPPMELEENATSGCFLNIHTNVLYTHSDTQRLQTYQKQDKRWWYHSVHTNTYKLDINTELQLIVDAHARSAFREFELDVDFIRETKTNYRFTGATFTFQNPSKM